jgi:hypothetical protein
LIAILYTDNTALLEESSSALSWYVIKPKTAIPNEERQIDNDGHPDAACRVSVRNNEDYLGKVSKLCHGAPGDGRRALVPNAGQEQEEQGVLHGGFKAVRHGQAGGQGLPLSGSRQLTGKIKKPLAGHTGL